MKKRILSLTGTRADYGIYKPVYEAIRQSHTLSLELIVTGMHLRREFGHTIDVIRADGFPVAAELDTLTIEDTPQSMAEYVGRTLIASAATLAEHRPDILLLLGDRGEMLAGAVAAAELGIPIAHLHGGEQTGTVDDRMRQAITHMASIHFTSTESHSAAVERMRGSPVNIHTVGAPALDVIRTLTPVKKEELCRKAGLDPSLPIVLFVQHPDTLDPRSVEDQLKPPLAALDSLRATILIISSNADAGGLRMNALLQSYAQASGNRVFIHSLTHEEFLSWEACADVLIGNSSSGIIEAASYHLPVVNIGDRQKGRTRSGNVIDVPYETTAIEQGIAKAMSADFRSAVQRCSNVYGDGHAAGRIVSVLETCAFPLP